MQMSIDLRRIAVTGAAALAVGFAGGAASAQSLYGFGTPASAEDIAAVDLDVRPDGMGAPPGQGTYSEGKIVYAEQCAACHGEDMAEPVKGTFGTPLRGGRGSLASGKASKTIESYWPYASTVFDYVKRAMPFQEPSSLSDDEVYSLVAYILAEGNIISKDTVMNAEALAGVEMPNRNGFTSDARPDVFHYD